MRITAEVSLYPLRDDYIPKILSFVRTLREMPGIEVLTNQMSTQLRGELTDVMPAIAVAVERSFADGAPEALTIKIVNADLPIAEAPDLDLAD